MALAADTAAGRSLPRWVRAGSHLAILALAAVLLRDVLATPGVALWPDKGFPLLVVALAVLTAGAALIRALTMTAPGWGEDLIGVLDRSGRLRLAVFAAAWLGYAALLPVLGFLIATTAAIALSAVALGRARPWLALPIAALIAVLLFAAMQRLLYVGLPLGPLDRALAGWLGG